MTDAVVSTDPTLNPSQSGPGPVPNVDRQPAPADTEAKTPEQIAAEAAAKGKTPEEIAAEAAAAASTEAPTLDGDDDEGAEQKLPTSADAVDGVVSYEPTGDVGMDMALSFVGKLGLGMDHPAMAATLQNDFGPLRAFLATLGDKATGWEAMVNLAEDRNKAFGEKAATAAKAINTAVSSVLGESQKDILAWASKAATPEEKRSINAMLRADPVQARAAAATLLQAYQAAGGTVVTPASAVRDPSGGNPDKQSLGRIGNKEFAVEAGKLSRRFGPAYQKTPEYAALSRRLG